MLKRLFNSLGVEYLFDHDFWFAISFNWFIEVSNWNNSKWTTKMGHYKIWRVFPAFIVVNDSYSNFIKFHLELEQSELEPHILL